MTTLHERLPDVAKEFDRGSFVVHKSTGPFSAIAIDHAHEQNNAVVKVDGGAIGLTQIPRAVLRWMVAGPEIARTIDGFETACLDNHTGRDNGRHHEHTMAVQVTFASEAQASVEVIEDLGSRYKLRFGTYKGRSHRLPGEAVHIQRRSSSHRRYHSGRSCYHQHAEASWSENLPRLCHVSVPSIHQSTVG